MSLDTRSFEKLAHLAPADAPRDADFDVVDLARRGDVDGALRRLMDRHGTSIYRYCREELHDQGLADDTHQQVFIAAFRSLPSFEGRSPVRSWLFGIARHRVLDAVKARKRYRTGLGRVATEQPMAVIDPGPPAGEALDDLRLREALHAELALLPEDVRSAVVLHYQHGLSITEVAEVLDEKPGTVSARLIRAMPVLRDRIEARLGARPHRHRAAR